MFATANRLRSSRDITRVYRQGRYGGGGVLSLKARKSSLEATRVVVVVGKKTDKRAVVRNRLRRRVIGALERLWDRVPAGYDIVVTVHENPGELPTAGLDQLVTRALERAGVQ